ncbi:MAG: bifunctional phosphopantothenoylcysteine decarboxylase/phosphopantothenate--cysteine ligase CoaBC [Chitinophagales bacterium]
MWKGKKVLLGITGSIAAYKALLLVRLLVKNGAEVRVICTPAAKDFVTPLSLSTLSKNPVLTELFDENAWANHVMLGRWADLFVIAPLSCNTLAKMANGICDNLLLATYLSSTCPVLAAPAMDEDMWNHPSTRANIEKIISYGNVIVPVENGELASGLYGDGRMAEPETIVSQIEKVFFLKKDLMGKKALVTAGPTHEAIDPVRFIGNHSSGKMGLALAEELLSRGAEVFLVMGPGTVNVKITGIHLEKVKTAAEMYRACIDKFSSINIAIMAAAVADYSPANPSIEKIKKKDGKLTLELVRTKDILSELGRIKTNGQVLVGFALENRNEMEYAKNKLREKNADMIVLNSLNDQGAGFGFETNKITIFEKNGPPIPYVQKTKQQVAKDIVDRIVKMVYA